MPKTSSATGLASPVENHRVRVGKERRDKMRKRLVAAVMSTYTQREGFITPVISDVIKVADVSRASFYAHFETMDEAISAVGQELVDEMLVSLEAFFKRSEDPLLRLTMGMQIFLLRSVTDPFWGTFVSRTNYLSHDTILFKTVERDLCEARNLKYLHFSDVEAASSLYVGTMMEAIRRLVKTDARNRGYVEELTALVLRGLGADFKKAQSVVEDRAIYIRGLAPDCLPWWRDPWRTD